MFNSKKIQNFEVDHFRFSLAPIPEFSLKMFTSLPELQDTTSRKARFNMQDPASVYKMHVPAFSPNFGSRPDQEQSLPFPGRIILVLRSRTCAAARVKGCDSRTVNPQVRFQPIMTGT